MWLSRVVARAFGPLAEETLELAPGMNVVVGPNEAGKSSWHAAMRLAVTGLRRGRGRATLAEAALEARHRPWDATDRWEVEARLWLADGRQVDITQDLAAKVACRAVDVSLGRDVSDEILDGTPDAARWLGLDRDAFAATVAVSQAQIMGVANAETAGQLQEFMQRAAATRGTDATAAEAIDRLSDFRRRMVGVDRSSAKGPLRLAKVEREEAAAALDDARERHAAYLERAARAERAAAAVAGAAAAVARAEAQTASARAQASAARLRRAEELAARYPEPPAGAATREARADRVAAALDGWRRRPAVPQLAGASAMDLAERIAALPQPPRGDREPAATVIDAARRLDLAEEALAAHRDTEPAADAGHPASAGGSVPLPRSTGLPIGIVLVLVGAGLAMAGIGVAAMALSLAGIVIAGWSWQAEASSRRDRLMKTQLARERTRAWQERFAQLEERVGAARDALQAAVTERDPRMAGDARARLRAYLAGCRERADAGTRAAERGPLQRELEARRELEATAAAVAEAVARAHEELRAAVRGIGEEAVGPADELAARLERWRQAQREAAARAEAATTEWHELRELLDEATLDDLRATAAQEAEQARRLRHALPDEPTSHPLEERDPTLLRDQLAAAQGAAADLTGELRALRSTLPDVAEAEERLAAADLELRRVEDLATTVDTALRLLRAAEERVHRDLAPILADAVRRWLPVVSQGAYTEVSVDPADLAVTIKESATGRWRDARLLSEGTREQVYLLLRVAMAQHLVRRGEVAPLLLDEVTAQSDGARKRQLLEVLHAVSAERQVVLFSHDEEVGAWAADHLDEPRDRLIVLRRGRAAPSEPSGSTAVPIG